MHYKAGRQNHDFQIAHFLVGSCHTADAAWSLLADQYEDRNNAIQMYEGAKRREKAKRLKAQRILDLEKTDVVTRLETEAEICELDALAGTTKKNVEAAIAERDFIKQCMDRLEPYRKFAHLSPAEAAQAAQRDEWRFELMRRAENYLITAGTIPHDHYNTMRMHPDFEKIIQPYTQNVHMLLKTGRGDEVLKLSKSVNDFNVVETLALTYEPREEIKLLESPKVDPIKQPTGALDFRRRG